MLLKSSALLFVSENVGIFFINFWIEMVIIIFICVDVIRLHGILKTEPKKEGKTEN